LCHRHSFVASRCVLVRARSESPTPRGSLRRGCAAHRPEISCDGDIALGDIRGFDMAVVVKSLGAKAPPIIMNIRRCSSFRPRRAEIKSTYFLPQSRIKRIRETRQALNSRRIGVSRVNDQIVSVRHENRPHRQDSGMSLTKPTVQRDSSSDSKPRGRSRTVVFIDTPSACAHII
jgi:hypothetical protein